MLITSLTFMFEFVLYVWDDMVKMTLTDLYIWSGARFQHLSEALSSVGTFMSRFLDSTKRERWKSKSPSKQSKEKATFILIGPLLLFLQDRAALQQLPLKQEPAFSSKSIYDLSFFTLRKCHSSNCHKFSLWHSPNVL